MNENLFAELLESVREGGAILRGEKEPSRAIADSALPLPFILTLQFDATTFARLDALRQAHFPPERNFLPAHITLFHALPGDQEVAIRQTLQTISAATPIIPLAFPSVRSLGRGVAITVASPALLALRQQLATTWPEWLGAQDRQRYQPHVTVQNKVTTEAARQLYEQLAASWQPVAGQGEGLLLWRYRGGPWEQVMTFPFQS
jgi:2'-5' RNA ligase